MYTVFVVKFNQMVTVRLTGQFTEGTWVTNRERFDTKPILANNGTLDHRGGDLRQGKGPH